MGYILNKPCTETERVDFIVRHNHQQGLTIEETENAIFALEAWEKLVGDNIYDDSTEYEKEQEEKEAERIAMLNLTRGDVFRGLLLAKGVTKEQIANMIEAMPATNAEEILKKELAKIDFEDALNFYRGVELIDTIGAVLGITSEQLDAFFETNDYTKLM